MSQMSGFYCSLSFVTLFLGYDSSTMKLDALAEGYGMSLQASSRIFPK